jgi:hypothetical protein
VTSSTVRDITFELARHEFQRTFYFLLDLRFAYMVLGLPWLDDEQASVKFGTTRVLTVMNGIAVETQIEDRRLECLLMSYGKVQKLMRKTRRSKGRNAEFYVIDISLAAEQPVEFHTRKEITGVISHLPRVRFFLWKVGSLLRIRRALYRPNEKHS